MALNRGLEILAQTYSALSYAKKLALVNALYTPPFFLYGWDIQALVGTNMDGFQITTPVNHESIVPETCTVLGRVFHTYTVNYLLWGAINRLIHDDPVFQQSWFGKEVVVDGTGLSPTLRMVAIYRGVRAGFGVWGDYRAAIAWAKAGWTRDFSVAMPYCLQVPPNTTVYQLGLGWRVAPTSLVPNSEGIIDFLG
jgi:hypothetical protein